MLIEPIWVIMPVLSGREYTIAAIADVLQQTVPVRLLVVNQGVDDGFRAELEHIAEAHADRVFVWSHQPPLPSLAATWNRALDFVWACGGDAALVVNNDVRLHRRTVEVLSLYLHDEQALFVSAVGVTADQFNPQEPSGIPSLPDGSRLTSRGGPDFSCFLITRDCHARYRFDEAFIPAYCVTPDTPVLTRALHWIPIGNLRVGSELLTVDEHARRKGPAAHAQRMYQPATVTHVERRLAPCVRMTMSDGRQVTCSTDHRWLVKRPEPSGLPFEWLAAQQLAPGWRIAAPLQPWAEGTSYDEGWLAGLIDGEGTLRLKGKNRCEVQIAQKPGLVYERAQDILATLGIPYTTRERTDNSVAVIEIGVRRHALRVLGQVRPVRLLQKFATSALPLPTFSRNASMALTITTIEPVGEQEVVTIETTTKTYLANGMVSHNCEDLDYHRRLLLGGDGARIFSVPLPFLHYASGTLKTSDADQRAAIDAAISAGSRAYYQQKWGGPVNQETFVHPFGPAPSPQAAVADVTTPALQEAERQRAIRAAAPRVVAPDGYAGPAELD